MLTQGSDFLNIVLTAGVNLSYAIICIIVGIVAMVVGYKVFDSFTPFDTATIIEKSPVAVGIFYGLIALGIAICSGLVIGLSVN